MTEFLVTWTINLYANTEREAAELALEMHRDKESIATEFEVLNIESNKSTLVDLNVSEQ